VFGLSPLRFSASSHSEPGVFKFAVFSFRFSLRVRDDGWSFENHENETSLHFPPFQPVFGLLAVARLFFFLLVDFSLPLLGRIYTLLFFSPPPCAPYRLVPPPLPVVADDFLFLGECNSCPEPFPHSKSPIPLFILSGACRLRCLVDFFRLVFVDSRTLGEVVTSWYGLFRKQLFPSVLPVVFFSNVLRVLGFLGDLPFARRDLLQDASALLSGS